jgi:hypothetical protein
MLKWIIRNRINAFEKRYAYDMGYARQLVAADTSAFLALAKTMKLGGYRKDVPLDAYWAAKIAGTISEDCGPCTQLVVSFALESGVDPRTLSAVLANDRLRMSSHATLAVDFARATLAHSPDADALREEIEKRWGPRALVSLAFAIVASRIYPTLKYALGHGKACQRVTVDGEPVVVARRSRPMPVALAQDAVA